MQPLLPPAQHRTEYGGTQRAMRSWMLLRKNSARPCHHQSGLHSESRHLAELEWTSYFSTWEIIIDSNLVQWTMYSLKTGAISYPFLYCQYVVQYLTNSWCSLNANEDSRTVVPSRLVRQCEPREGMEAPHPVLLPKPCPVYLLHWVAQLYLL